MLTGLGTLLGPASGVVIFTLLLLAAPLAWPWLRRRYGQPPAREIPAMLANSRLSRLRRVPLQLLEELIELFSVAALAAYDGAAELDERLSIVLAGLRSQLRT